jgi:hypothetical protein
MTKSAPKDFAICTAKVPMPPEAPLVRTFWPLLIPPARRPRRATRADRGTVAASSNESASVSRSPHLPRRRDTRRRRLHRTCKGCLRLHRPLEQVYCFLQLKNIRRITFCACTSLSSSRALTELVVEITNDCSKRENPQHVEERADEEVTQDITCVSEKT